MDTKINKGNLKVSQTLVDFLEKEVLELLDLDINKFWINLCTWVETLTFGRRHISSSCSATTKTFGCASSSYFT